MFTGSPQITPQNSSQPLTASQGAPAAKDQGKTGFLDRGNDYSAYTDGHGLSLIRSVKLYQLEGCLLLPLDVPELGIKSIEGQNCPNPIDASELEKLKYRFNLAERFGRASSPYLDFPSEICSQDKNSCPKEATAVFKVSAVHHASHAI